MRLYFIKDVKAGFAPKGLFKAGHVYDVSGNNVSTMIDNNFAIHEGERPQNKVVIKKPVVQKKTYKKRKK